jgi:DNA end-binding protein Ku
MARPLWSGSISFGLVTIPVRMFTAEREHEVRFHQLNKKTGNRIKYDKVDAETGKDVESDDIVRGYEVAEDSWVTIEDEELDALRPESTRTVDIEDFVDLRDIDPIYFDRTYYLAPDDNTGAKRAYALLLTAMERTERAGIGKVVIHNKQYLAAVRPYRHVLALSTMRFADEVVDVEDLDDLDLRLPDAEPKARKMAESLIDSLTGRFTPEKYRDTYTDEVRELLARKAKGEKIEPVDQPSQSPKVVDLMAALQASVEATASRRNKGKAAAKPQPKSKASAGPKKKAADKSKRGSKKRAAA